MTQYLALIKVAVDADPAQQRYDIIEQVEMVAGRLVEEFGMAAADVQVAFEQAIDMAYETERWMEENS